MQSHILDAVDLYVAGFYVIFCGFDNILISSHSRHLICKALPLCNKSREPLYSLLHLEYELVSVCFFETGKLNRVDSYSHTCQLELLDLLVIVIRRFDFKPTLSHDLLVQYSWQ